jgi:Rrf2 family protein
MSSFLRIPSRVHHGLLLVTALAKRSKPDETLSLEAVATAEGVSQGYLEQIASKLREAHIIEGKRGKQGGYRLTVDPSRVTVGNIIEAIEGPISMVTCTGGDCPRSGACANEDVWHVIQQEMMHLLDSLTLEEVLDLSRHDHDDAGKQ